MAHAGHLRHPVYWSGRPARGVSPTIAYNCSLSKGSETGVDHMRAATREPLAHSAPLHFVCAACADCSALSLPLRTNLVFLQCPLCNRHELRETRVFGLMITGFISYQPFPLTRYVSSYGALTPSSMHCASLSQIFKRIRRIWYLLSYFYGSSRYHLSSVNL